MRCLWGCIKVVYFRVRFIFHPMRVGFIILERNNVALVNDNIDTHKGLQHRRLEDKCLSACDMYQIRNNMLLKRNCG